MQLAFHNIPDNSNKEEKETNIVCEYLEAFKRLSGTSDLTFIKTALNNVSQYNEQVTYPGKVVETIIACIKVYSTATYDYHKRLLEDIETKRIPDSHIVKYMDYLESNAINKTHDKSQQGRYFANIKDLKGDHPFLKTLFCKNPNIKQTLYEAQQQGLTKGKILEILSETPGSDQSLKEIKDATLLYKAPQAKVGLAGGITGATIGTSLTITAILLQKIPQVFSEQKIAFSICVIAVAIILFAAIGAAIASIPRVSNYLNGVSTKATADQQTKY